MGPTKIHVGFGSRATWGGINGTGAAPNWLINAATKGWNNPLSFPNPRNSSSLFSVNARNGLNLRSGPSQDFRIIRTLSAGSIVRILDFDGTNQEWAQIDLEGDGVSDGYVFRSFLKPVQDTSESRIMTFTAQPINELPRRKQRGIRIKKEPIVHPSVAGDIHCPDSSRISQSSLHRHAYPPYSQSNHHSRTRRPTTAF
ncbi:SH3 domain-containing protein [Leptolyngbya sp. GB1-A1]